MANIVARLIRLRWSVAPLLFANPEDMFSHVEAHIVLFNPNSGLMLISITLVENGDQDQYYRRVQVDKMTSHLKIVSTYWLLEMPYHQHIGH